MRLGYKTLFLGSPALWIVGTHPCGQRRKGGAGPGVFQPGLAKCH